MPRRTGEAVTTPVKKGLALVQALQQQIKNHGLLDKEAAKIIGISATHLSDILTANRYCGTLGDNHLRKIAGFLEIAPISVFMLAERLTPEDFFLASTVEERVGHIFKFMQKDPSIAGSTPTPKDWKKAPLSVQLLTAILYEKMVQKDLLDHAQVMEISVAKK